MATKEKTRKDKPSKEKHGTKTQGGEQAAKQKRAKQGASGALAKSATPEEVRFIEEHKADGSQSNFFRPDNPERESA